MKAECIYFPFSFFFYARGRAHAARTRDAKNTNANVTENCESRWELFYVVL